MNTGNRIEGAKRCPSRCRPLRPLFHFLCSVLYIHRVQYCTEATNKDMLHKLCVEKNIFGLSDQLPIAQSGLGVRHRPLISSSSLNLQGDHSGCAKPHVDTKNILRFCTWASSVNGTFVLMSTGGLTRPEWPPCIGRRFAPINFSEHGVSDVSLV